MYVCKYTGLTALFLRTTMTKWVFGVSSPGHVRVHAWVVYVCVCAPELAALVRAGVYLSTWISGVCGQSWTMLANLQALWMSTSSYTSAAARYSSAAAPKATMHALVYYYCSLSGRPAKTSAPYTRVEQKHKTATSGSRRRCQPRVQHTTSTRSRCTSYSARLTQRELSGAQRRRL